MGPPAREAIICSCPIAHRPCNATPGICPLSLPALAAGRARAGARRLRLATDQPADREVASRERLPVRNEGKVRPGQARRWSYSPFPAAARAPRRSRYGVLEELRRTEVVVGGRRTRLLDEVDLITGVSGGSFTALAYGLYGEKLFDDYEQAFPQARRPGRAARAAAAPAQLAVAVVGGLGPLGAGGAALRRDPVRERDVRRPDRHGPARW